VTGDWRVVRTAGPAGPFHAHQPDDDPEPAVWVHSVGGTALVLGSAQRDDVVDHDAVAALGVEVVRRRSGGGAVLLEPGGVLWIDVVVPRGHRHWSDDVALASHWLGDAWSAALDAVGLVGDVHRGRLVRGPWSDVVCFAGLGPGEVTLRGRKVVGISQRRTRSWARFQCAALTAWDPVPLLRLLALDDASREKAAAELADAATGTGVSPGALEVALLHEL
jgi:lipoate-protein ligase A